MITGRLQKTTRKKAVGNKMRKPLELYVHIPFCVKKCDYCDFLSGYADRERQESYIRALLAEIAGIPADPGREVISVFIGGGTPSVMDAAWIGEILDALNDKFVISPEAEMTMEANPGTLTREKLGLYRAHGINRLSIGLQSPKDEELKILGRIHTYQEFLKSYTMAREAGFSNINIDLMCAIPGQTYEGWIENLCIAAQLSPEHISAYSLIIEEGTPFAEKELALPDEETEYRMYEDTAAVLAEYGYRQYEISNYAKEGFACRHNIGYWKRTEYLGLGLGAASLYEGLRFANTGNMEEYLTGSRDAACIRRDILHLSEREQMEEFMFLGLRMTEGICEQEFQKQFGRLLPEIYGTILEKYENMGFLERKAGFWRFTRAGIHVSNQILADFLA